MATPQATVAELGFVLMIAGFIIVFLAVVLLIIASLKGGGRVRGGGIILIGPIPIMYATDKKSAYVLSILMIAIIVIALVLTYIAWGGVK